MRRHEIEAREWKREKHSHICRPWELRIYQFFFRYRSHDLWKYTWKGITTLDFFPKFLSSNGRKNSNYRNSRGGLEGKSFNVHFVDNYALSKTDKRRKAWMKLTNSSGNFLINPGLNERWLQFWVLKIMRKRKWDRRVAVKLNRIN